MLENKIYIFILLLMRKQYIVAYLMSTFILTYCSKVHKGYKFETNDAMTIQQMVSQGANINQIINKFGSPSFVNSPINDTICYIDANGKKVAFNRFYKPTYQFLCIVFENQIAKEIKQMSLTNIQTAKMISYDIKFDKPL